MRPDAIGPQDALIVLQHFGHTTPGVPDMTGTFRGRLVALIAEADAHDQRHLANAYPALVAAVRLAVSSPTGIATLHAIASTR